MADKKTKGSSQKENGKHTLWVLLVPTLLLNDIDGIFDWVVDKRHRSSHHVDGVFDGLVEVQRWGRAAVGDDFQCFGEVSVQDGVEGSAAVDGHGVADDHVDVGHAAGNGTGRSWGG